MSFILLATQRTGSSWVQEMLHSHPSLKVYSELFLPDASGMPMWEPSDVEFAASFVGGRARPPTLITRRYWTVAYLRRLFGQPGELSVGFKYMYDQVPHSPEVLVYAAATRVPVVHLIRRNLLDTVISAELAASSGLYHLPADGRPAIPWLASERGEERIRLDPDQVVAELTKLERERRRFRRWLELTRTPTVEVEYEALVADPSRFGRVLEFLGVPDPDPSPLECGLKKVRTESRADVIANYPELEATLSATPFAAFLTA
ncbi:MAG TPA: Stf0 family sulfotransferase [Solirubrobacteraceae bacterium]|jgi:LPS sulfotransferase NodH